MVRLETERLVIRELGEEDIPALHAIFSDPEVWRHMDFIKSDSLEHTTEQIRGMIMHNSARPRHAYNFAVLGRRENRIVGWIGFGDPDPPKRHIGQADFGYAFGKEHWSKGYGTECLTAVVRFAFEEVGVETFFGECDKENPASSRVMEKCGFTRIAALTEDSFCYLITRADWARGMMRRSQGKEELK